MNKELEQISRLPLGHEMRRLWTLEGGMHFLNHGSFGATPRYVLKAQGRWRARLERQPVRFMTRELPAALRTAAATLAAFVGTAGERIAFVENATGGINAVLRSMTWHAGENIVIANHAYPAVRNAVSFIARRHGLMVVEADIPFPLGKLLDVERAYRAAITAKTRLVIVDHVFSPLAVVAPLKQIVAHCRSRGVPVLVDGAHAPGMLPLSLDSLGADWYVGNCHKWLFAAKGCAFIFASPAAARQLHPATVSNLYGQGFPTEFDWQGTRDYSAWLSVTAALEFLKAIGVERYRDYLQQQTAVAARLMRACWKAGFACAAKRVRCHGHVALQCQAAAGKQGDGGGCKALA
jgi:isopenicillin-N epimerase